MLLNMISVYLFIGVIVTTSFAALLQSRSKDSYVRSILLLSFVIDIYMFGYASELTSGTISTKLFWNYFQYLGIPFVSAMWLTIGLLFTNRFHNWRWCKLLFLFAIPFLTMLFRFTNSLHHLYFASINVQTIGDRFLLVKENGPWLYVQLIHSISMIILTFAIYIHSFIKRRDQENGIYMLSASAIAGLGLIFNFIKFGGICIDYTVISLPISIVFIVFAVLKHDMLETKALARNLIFENNDEGMLLLSSKRKILDYNASASEIFQIQGINLYKGTLDDVFIGHSELSKLLITPQDTIWKANNHDGDQFFSIRSIDITQTNGTVTGNIITIRNITEMHLLYKQLKLQATTDELTGLLNRREFSEQCEAQLQRRRSTDNPSYIFMIDIDWFKHINDTYGHMAGDIVIESLGDVLRKNFRTTDLIGRLGGEEFIIFMQTDNRDAAYQKAEQTRELVERTRFCVDKNTFLQITVSIGLIEIGSEQDFPVLMNKVDKAMYESKNSGKNKTSIYKEENS